MDEPLVRVVAQRGRLTRARAAVARTRRFVAAAGLAASVLAVALTAAPAAAWKPGPERFGVGERHNVPVRMRDGTVLRANVFYPTDRSTGKAAAGPFPVIMVQTPYGKDTVGSFSGDEGGAEAGSEAGPL